MNETNKKVVTRFAPSPTGFMHVGGVRTALFSYLYAKKHGGSFILRIEDTDKEREVKGSIEHIMESLKWLGIDWDEGPGIDGPHAQYIQSKRLDIYRKYAQILIDKGFAYADPYTQEELESFRKKAEEEKRAFLYREHRPKENIPWDGTKPLRFKIPEIKRYEWHDLVYGDLSAGEEALDDFILIKSDGYPTYNFAHIVDDIEMNVTHVMRAQEFLASTPKFLAVYDAFGITPPLFATLPHIMAPGGKKKLSKRDGAKDLLEYKKEGFLPEAMINFLAFLGWNPGDEREIMSMNEIIKDFNIEKVQRGGAQWNEEKLSWINREYLNKLSYEEKEEYISNFIPEQIKTIETYSNEILHNMVPVIMDHITVGSDIIKMTENGEIDFYFKQPTYNKDSLFFKSSKIEGTSEKDKYQILSSYLEKVLDILDKTEEYNWNKETIKENIWPYAEEIGRGDILWPLRYAISGREKSPDPFILCEIIGKTETKNRISKAIQILTKA